MYTLEKFYPEDFNPQRYWDDKYAQEHIAGKSSSEFKKQGFWPVLESQLEETGRYLDVGCGVGGWILFLKEQGYDIEGIDIAARTVRALTEYDPELKLKVASMTAIPYPDENFDGVLAIGTLEYIEGKIPQGLSEVRRVLRRGGWFFMEVPVVNGLRRWFYLPLKRLEGIIRRAQGRQPTFSNYLFERRELKDLLYEHGFEVIMEKAHELPEPDSHFGLYIDWKFLRGHKPYQLNALGLLVKKIANALSPWIASTGMVVVARKRS